MEHELTLKDREQEILKKQMELDELNFQIEKKKKERELRKQTGIGAKVKDALDDIGQALDGFGDMGTTEINGNPKPIKSIDKLASFD